MTEVNRRSPSLLEEEKLHAEIKALRATARHEEALAKSVLIKNQLAEHDLEDATASRAQLGQFRFYAPVDQEAVVKLILTMSRASHLRPGCDMVVGLNTEGGSVNHGFALYDFIQELKSRGHKVTIRVEGNAASMGAILLQAATERVMSPNSYLMIHKVSTEFKRNTRLSEDDVADHHEMLKKYNDHALDILEERSKLTRDEIGLRWLKKDWFLNAEEAVELGFADRIETY